MSTALAVCHGAFGRVTVYRLDQPMRTHAHREGHLTYLLSGPPAIVTICDVPHLVDETAGVAINPWQPHSFQPGPAIALGLSGGLYLRSLARPGPARPRQPPLRRQQDRGWNDDPFDCGEPRPCRW